MKYAGHTFMSRYVFKYNKEYIKQKYAGLREEILNKDWYIGDYINESAVGLADADIVFNNPSQDWIQLEEKLVGKIVEVKITIKLKDN